jgi:glycine betaine/proline transport system ATP-binding protein
LQLSDTAARNIKKMSKIEINNVYKIFGSNPKSVLPKVKDGATKEEILEKTGHTVGLDNVSLKIEEGETFVCMGLSGSGKSTLIRHLNRLIDPTAGEILVEGTNVMSLNTEKLIDFRRHKMSMVFQRFGLFPHKTVIQNVSYGLEMQGKSEDEKNKIAMEKIESVGLSGFENQYPNQLSGGMQQRVGLARALATNTDIMLMDEAFSALDPLIRSDMQKQLIDLQSELKKTIVFITHDLDESLRLGDHIGILNAGKLVQVGTPVDIVMNPADDYVEAFVKDVNRAKVIKAKVIMKPVNQANGIDKKNLIKVQEDQFIDEFLPQVVCTDANCEVVDKKGNVKGYITNAELQKSLTKN